MQQISTFVSQVLLEAADLELKETQIWKRQHCSEKMHSLTTCPHSS